MSTIIPLAMPEQLHELVRKVAKETGLSQAETMRQSMALGLPTLEERLSPLSGLKPLTKEELRQCYKEPNPEFDALERHMACLPAVPPRNE